MTSGLTCRPDLWGWVPPFSSRCVRSWLTAGRRGAGCSVSDSGLPLGAPPSRPDGPKYVAWDGNRAQRGSGALAMHEELEREFWPAGGGSWGWRWGPLSRIGPRVYMSLNGSAGEFEGASGLGPKPAGVSEASGRISQSWLSWGQGEPHSLEEGSEPWASALYRPRALESYLISTPQSAGSDSVS